MHPRVVRGSVLLLALLAIAPGSARADVGSDLMQHVGAKVDLTANPALKSELVAATIVGKDATEITVNAEVLAKAFAAQRFRNQVDATRYHVGERILVETPGSVSRYSPRAEIAAINPDGTYQVKVWDKVEPLDHPGVTDEGYVRVFTGKAPAGSPRTTVRHTNPDGTTTTEEIANPWLVRENERTITLTHAEIDALNGRVATHSAFTLNGYTVDPANDWVLQERIAQANALADKMFKPGTLLLPADAAGRKKALDKISRLQERFVDEIFKMNYMEHPGNERDPKAPGFDQEFPELATPASQRLQKVLQDHPDLRGKVGSLLLAKYGVCTEQAAAIASVLEGVAGRIGLTIRPLQGRTIDHPTMHGFDVVRFANGVLGMLDVTWHFIDEADKVHAVDSLDFATYDKRPDSNRNIDVVAQPTTDPTTFVDRTSPHALDLSRGYTKDQAEAYLAAAAKDHAAANNVSFEDAAAAVLAGNTRFERVGGDFTPAAIASRARAIDARPNAAGFLSTLDHTGNSLVNDRVRDAVDPAGRVVDR